ncbi:MAG: cell division ATP-binding protein FtsE [Flavobacteriales bacterium]
MNKQPLIQLQNASVAQAEHLVLKEVNLEVMPGELVYLIGKTGSGKSSLLRAIYGDLPLRGGSGMVCGHDLTKINRKNVHQLRRDLGIVFQDFALLQDRSAAANLDFVLDATGWKRGKTRENRIQSCLEAVGLGTKGYKMPHALSGGEQQRLAIARALLNEPHLIVADEPTGNLDPETTEGILQLLHSLVQQDRAVVMATHDHHALERYPGRVMECVGGMMNEKLSIAG